MFILSYFIIKLAQIKRKAIEEEQIQRWINHFSDIPSIIVHKRHNKMNKTNQNWKKNIIYLLNIVSEFNVKYILIQELFSNLMKYILFKKKMEKKWFQKISVRMKKEWVPMLIQPFKTERKSNNNDWSNWFISVEILIET